MRLIDADTLMEMANDTFDMVGNTCLLMNAKDFLRNFIDTAPTIDQVKHGMWIEYPIAEGMNKCSECGVLRFGESNYCPNCGAKMDKGESDA